MELPALCDRALTWYDESSENAKSFYKQNKFAYSKGHNHTFKKKWALKEEGEDFASFQNKYSIRIRFL